MKYFIVNVLFFAAFFKAASTSNHSEPGNQVLFTVIGQTTRESGYAHLVIPIPMPDITKTLDTLQDLIKASNGARYTQDNFFRKTEKYGVNRIQAKIDLILSLARKNGFVAKEL